jgi:hypothetical protein
LKFTEPFESKKNGNRASRVGPLAVMKGGVVSFGATLLPANPNWGLIAPPDPPTAGWIWHELHEFELKRGPKPLGETASTSWNWSEPALKNAVNPFGSFVMMVAPVPRLAL